MGRSVSYPSAAQVVTFGNPEFDCMTCEDGPEKGRVLCDCSDPTSALSAEDRAECGDCDGLGTVKCPDCEGYGSRSMDGDDFDMLVDDFRDHLRSLFPSVEPADDWIGREDHVLAENRLARFGMSEILRARRLLDRAARRGAICGPPIQRALDQEHSRQIRRSIRRADQRSAQ